MSYDPEKNEMIVSLGNDFVYFQVGDSDAAVFNYGAVLELAENLIGWLDDQQKKGMDVMIDEIDEAILGVDKPS